MQADEQDKEVSPIVAIAKSKDIERVKTEILKYYHFEVTDQYAQDLITFVEELAAEMMS